MFVWDLIFALAVGLVFAAIFSLVFGRTGPWASFFVFFIIIALAAWAGGVWFKPVGPPVHTLKSHTAPAPHCTKPIIIHSFY
jgi:sugar phosphate permease